MSGCNPHWNASMQFLIKDVTQDILCLTVFDRDFFSPNGEEDVVRFKLFSFCLF